MNEKSAVYHWIKMMKKNLNTLKNKVIPQVLEPIIYV